jgi:hypothetical protein
MPVLDKVRGHDFEKEHWKVRPSSVAGPWSSLTVPPSRQSLFVKLDFPPKFTLEQEVELDKQ